MLFTLLMVGIIVSIVLALTAIFLPKLRSVSEMKNSVGALYAAESGAEWCLYVMYQDFTSFPNPPVLDNGATLVNSTGNPLTSADCSAAAIKVLGTYNRVTRAFEITP